MFRDFDYQPLIIPYTDQTCCVTTSKDISVSPFTLVFQHAGLLSAAAIMNTGYPDGGTVCRQLRNVCLDPALHPLACDGKAPRIFAKLSRGAAYRAMHFMPPP